MSIAYLYAVSGPENRLSHDQLRREPGLGVAKFSPRILPHNHRQRVLHLQPINRRMRRRDSRALSILTLIDRALERQVILVSLCLTVEAAYPYSEPLFKNTRLTRSTAYTK